MAAALTAVSPVHAQAVRSFAVASKDGTLIRGQADLPRGRPKVGVVMVAGTGLFDRDVAFGRSNSPRDLLFKDLAARMTARGVAVVRYDRRGVRHGGNPATRLNAAEAGSATVESQRDDLAAVYAWARSKQGPGARCLVLFGHSEGVAHIARLAESGAPAPLMVLGVGAPMESPLAIVRWQMSGRDVDSLRLMDGNKDGRTTNAEVEANWRRTPSAAFDMVEPFKHPNGMWTEADLSRLAATQAALYQAQKAAALSIADSAPYPNAATPMAGRAGSSMTSLWRSG